VGGGRVPLIILMEDANGSVSPIFGKSVKLFALETMTSLSQMQVREIETKLVQ
jgi:hypothetical protein